MPAGCEIGWCVVGSDAAFVIAKDRVHDPVQGILDGPVGSHHRADRGGQHRQRDHVEARLVGDLAVDFAPAFDHDDGLQARPLMARLQPVDIVDYRVVSGLDTSVIAIDGFMGLIVVSLYFKAFCSSTKTSTSSHRVP